MDIRIIVNKKEKTVSSGTTCSQLLMLLGYPPKAAIWINGKQLLISNYDSRLIFAGDEIKITRIVGGG